MTGMIERVQAALQKVLIDDGADTRALTIAAITAMRKPTKAMKKAFEESADYAAYYVSADTALAAMVDAALVESAHDSGKMPRK